MLTVPPGRESSPVLPPPGRQAQTASWKGFGVTLLKNHKSMALLSVGLITGAVVTGIGIRERHPGIYMAVPLGTVCLETLYLGYKAWGYFYRNYQSLEDHQSLEDLEWQAATSDENIIFLESFINYYDSIATLNLESRSELFKCLKVAFRSYFEKHQDLKQQCILGEDVESRAMLEGIAKHYKLDVIRSQPFLDQHGYSLLETRDDGDCLYDAIWQGLSDSARNLSLQKVAGAEESMALLDSGQQSYIVLKNLLSRVADEKKYRELILKNNQDAGSASYTCIEQYKELLHERDKLWGRHDVEGKILAEELDLNLTLIGGCDYIASVGFIDWEDDQIYTSTTRRNVVYISNSYQHYSAVGKRESSVTGQASEVIAIHP